MSAADPDGAAAEPFEIALAEPVALSGRVLDTASGRPVPGARLAARSGGELHAARADGAGRYSVGALRAGEWDLLVEAAGYVPWRREGESLATSERATLDVPLERAAALRGRVVNEQGEPVAGALCRLDRGGAFAYESFMAMLRARGAARTDADGRFELSGAASEQPQSLFVRHEDYAPRTLGGVELRPGEPVAPLTVVLSRGLTVRGVVQDPEREPVAGAKVRLSQARRFSAGALSFVSSGGPGGLPDRQTGHDGGFELSGLSPGNYMLHVSHDGYAPASVDPLRVGDDEPAEPIEVTLRRGATISGVVRTGAGEPAVGFRVAARAASAEAAAPARSMGPLSEPTGSDGVFLIEGAVHGATYDLEVFGDGISAGGEQGVVAPAQGVELSAPGDGRIAGRVIDQDGHPVTAFEVSYAPAPAARTFRFGAGRERPGFGANRLPVRSSSGAFVLERVPAGTWSVVARAEGFQEGHASGVEVAEGRATEGVQVRLAPGLAIRGRAVDGRSGRPVPDTRVEATSAHNNGVYFGTDGPNTRRTDVEGRFEIDGLAPGTYTLTARHPEWSEASVSVELATGGADVELRMEEGAQVLGVVLSGSAPVPNAAVAMAAAGARFMGPFDTFTAVSDADGRFRFDHVNPGRYTVTAEAQQRASQPAEVVVAADGTAAEVVVRLDGGARIVGTVEGLPEEMYARVSVSASGPGGYSASGRAARDGRFELTGAPAGAITLHGWAGDWDGSRGARTELTIAEGQAEAYATLRFPEGFRLEGRVTRGGEPVAGASLRAHDARSGVHASSRSDAAGRYVLDGLAEGSYELTVHSRSGTGARLTREVALSADAVLDLELPTARIAGRVSDAETALPLGEVRVEADAPDGAWLGSTSSDSDGRFALEDLESGTYRVRFQKQAYQTELRTVEAAEQGEVAIELKRGEGIAVEVRDGIYGTPLRELLAAVVDPSGSVLFRGRVSLDGAGRGEVPGIPPGRHALRVAASGYATRALSDVPSPSSRLALTLTPGGALEIHVGPASLERTDARARLLRPDGGVYFPSVFSTDGAIELQRSLHRLENVAPGQYLLVVDGAQSRDLVVREGATSIVKLP